MGDLSSQSGDHGVHINPGSRAAHRGRPRPGHAALRRQCDWRSGQRHHRRDPDEADDGRQRQLHVRSRDRPRRKAARPATCTSATARSRCTPAAAVADRATCDTPEGDVDNSQSRNGFGNVGLSWTGAKGYFGGSYGYDDTKYGIPVVEEGQVQLTPRRHAFSLRGGAHGRRRRVRLVSRDARRAPLQARRARGRRGRHRVQERHRRSRSDGLAPRARPIEGERRRMVAEPGVRRDRRRGAVTGGRPARVRRVHLRGSDVATRHIPVWRTPRSLAVRAGRRNRAQFHDRVRLTRLAAPPRRGERPRDRRAQPGACSAEPGARGAVLLRAAPWQLRLRGRQSRISNPEHALRIRLVAAMAVGARLGRGHLLPQRHQRLRLPDTVTEDEFASRLPEFAARFPGRGIGERTRRQPTSSRSSSTSRPTASFRESRRTPTSSSNRASRWSSASITSAER